MCGSGEPAAPTRRPHPPSVQKPSLPMGIDDGFCTLGGAWVAQASIRVADCYAGLMTTVPTRVDGELFAAAKSAGALHSRSATQQIDHWARIGRALEASGAVSQRNVERVLAGQALYDSLAEPDQAVVRVAWDEAISAGIAGLDLESEFRSTGDSWSEADDQGRVVVRGAASERHEPDR